MKRREFIGLAAAGAAGLVLPASGRDDDARAASLAHPRLLQIFREERMVREVGERYRETRPAENNSRALIAAILADVGEPARVDERVRRDFTEGRTVTLHGWVLSVTEARQCALFSLQST